MDHTISLGEVRRSLYTAVVCDVLDGLGFRAQSPRIAFLVRTGSDLVAGRCKTTLWEEIDHPDPDPYALELRAVDECRADSVFVAAAGGSMRSGIWGELLSTAAANQGCVGAIVDGAVRDIVAMERMEFSVYARGTSPYDSLHRQRVVELDVPVTLGGVVFQPDALVLADRDGVVVVPPEVETEALRLAWDKVHAENRTRDAIRGGLSAGEAWRKYGVL